jgi:Flp pilus assembly protein TadD
MSNLNNSKATRQEKPPSEMSLADIISRSQSDFELDFFSRIASQAPCYADILEQLGHLLTLKGQHEKALDIDRRLAKLRPQVPQVAYNLACSYSLLGRTNEAINALRHAIELGYWDIDHLLMDPDLTGLHDIQEFQDLLSDLDFEIIAD